MSLKSALFNGYVSYPKTKDKFMVVIEGRIKTAFRVESCELPFFKFKMAEMVSFGDHFSFPVSLDSSSNVFSCVFIEDASLSSLDDMKGVMTTLTSVGPIPLNIQVFIMDQYTGDIPVAKFNFYGCFVESISNLGLSYVNATDVIRYHVTFRFISMSVK